MQRKTKMEEESFDWEPIPLHQIRRSSPLLTEQDQSTEVTMVRRVTASLLTSSITDATATDSGAMHNYEGPAQQLRQRQGKKRPITNFAMEPTKRSKLLAPARQRAPSYILATGVVAKKVRFHPPEIKGPNRARDGECVLVEMRSLPTASTLMTPYEKQQLWYTGKESDELKISAARDAGVRMVKHWDGKHFVQVYSREDANPTGDRNGDDTAAVGSFSIPSQHNEAQSHCPNATAAATASRGREEKEEERCERGLDYHFSRSRKRALKITRLAVLTWQEKARDPTAMQRLIDAAIENGTGASGGTSNARGPASDVVPATAHAPAVASASATASSSPTSSLSATILEDGAAAANSDAGKGSPASSLSDASPSEKTSSTDGRSHRHPPLDDRAQWIIALVCSKCTRRSSEEAERRGFADYEAVYPELAARLRQRTHVLASNF